MYITLIVSRLDMSAIGCTLGLSIDGNTEAVKKAYDGEHYDCYEWLSQQSAFFEFEDLKVEYHSLEDDRICFSANAWGAVYWPVTNALEAKGLSWEEV